MLRTRIKICGLVDPAMAVVAAEAGADAIGLVFVDGSPRQVQHEQARRVIDALPPWVDAVGLFVDETLERIQSICAALGIRTVQLHGRESPDDAAKLAPLRVIKVVAVTSAGVEQAVGPWRHAPANVSGLLFDAAASSDGLSGGTGRCFDWQMLAALDRSGCPATIVAGGLTPQNVTEAIATIRPWGVDVSSGVEAKRGIKNAELIRAFTRAAQSADL